MNALATETVETTYPCCNRPARFTLWLGLPRQRFARTCKHCSEEYDQALTYDVIVTTTEPRPGIRVHRISWADNTEYTWRGRNPHS